jgi:hypothetical protein
VTSAAADADATAALDAAALGATLGATLGASEGAVVAPLPEQAPTKIVAMRATAASRFERWVVTNGSSCGPHAWHARPDKGLGRLGLGLNGCAGPSTALLRLVKAQLTMGRIQAIADASNGHEMDWTVGFGLDLGAQPTNVNVDRSRVADLVEAPDAIEQLAPRERSPRVGGEHRQELELLGSQVHRAAVAAQLVSDEIELEVSGDLEGAVPRPRTFLEQCGAIGQFLRVDRLRERFVVALPKRLEPSGGRGQRAEVNRPKARPTTPLSRDERHVVVVSRWHRHDRDPRAGIVEQLGERRRVRDSPDPRPGADQPLQFEGGTIGCEDEPAGRPTAGRRSLIGDHGPTVEQGG